MKLGQQPHQNSNRVSVLAVADAALWFRIIQCPNIQYPNRTRNQPAQPTRVTVGSSPTNEWQTQPIESSLPILNRGALWRNVAECERVRGRMDVAYRESFCPFSVHLHAAYSRELDLPRLARWPSTPRSRFPVIRGPHWPINLRDTAASFIKYAALKTAPTFASSFPTPHAYRSAPPQHRTV